LVEPGTLRDAAKLCARSQFSIQSGTAPGIFVFGLQLLERRAKCPPSLACDDFPTGAEYGGSNATIGKRSE
jgi:hypothetical protein